MDGNIFINYRRGDDPGFTQALFGRLEQAFPPERLFIDVDDIAPGLDFVQVLNDQVARCDVLIAVIGQNWLGATDETGARRLDNPDDFVRIEIASALAQKKRVIPVLVNEARMPRAADLPEPIRAFARCNAVRLTHERFRADMQGLIKSLEQVLKDADAARHAREEEARREAEAREAEEAQRRKQQRLEQGRKPRGAEADGAAGETPRRASSDGIAGWIAALPSEISWYVPFAVVGVFLLGWLLPGTLFSLRFAWGIGSLVYGLAGLAAVGAAIYVRREAMGGAELALYWYAAASFISIIVISVVHHYELGGSLNSDVAVTAVSLAALLVLRRRAWVGGIYLLARPVDDCLLGLAADPRPRLLDRSVRHGLLGRGRAKGRRHGARGSDRALRRRDCTLAPDDNERARDRGLSHGRRRRLRRRAVSGVSSGGICGHARSFNSTTENPSTTPSVLRTLTTVAQR